MRRIGAVMMAALLVVGCSNAGAVHDAIERSTAPLLVPTGQWRSAFDFTAPPGSTDVYHMRWNFRAGATDIVNGWQMGPTAVLEASSEPAADGLAMQAALDDDCEVVDDAVPVRRCSYPSEFARDGADVFLVRNVGDRVLVIEYLNIDGDRLDYNPEALGARFITATFDAMAIDGDLSDYLVYNS